MVEVYNPMDHEHKEMFKGELVTIPAKSSIQMPRRDAIQFMGQFTEVKLDGQDLPDPAYFKQLEIRPLKEAPAPVDKVEEVEAHRCMKCGEEFESASQLRAHLKKHKDEVITDADAEERLKKRTGSGNKAKG